MSLEKPLKKPDEEQDKELDDRSAIIDRVKSMRESYMHGGGKKEIIARYNRILALAQELERKYPDAEEYLLFHTLNHSSPGGEKPKFDFPGEDSVVKLLTDLCEEEKEKEELVA